jgi:hypothetical protein
MAAMPAASDTRARAVSLVTSLLARALRSALYGLGFGAVIAYLFGQDLALTLTYSVCVAILCWACIDASMLLLAFGRLAGTGKRYVEEEHRWPGWPWMLPIILVSSAVAYVGGSIAGDWITGEHTPRLLGMGANNALKSLVVCIVPAVAISYFYYSRRTIARREAEAIAARQQAAESRLKLLESQLEPHMLFNTLANLRVLIVLDPPRAQAMLDQLIAFLRATLNGSRALEHPLSEEFARLRDYLALMQVRMADRLQTSFELPEALAPLPVPPLLLQPLVENCIKHGLEPALEGGLVDIRARREDGALVLSVRDTGVGLAHGAQGNASFGLRQVRERLATLYGSRATLVVAAAADGGGGTIATIRLPLPADGVVGTMWAPGTTSSCETGSARPETRPHDRN